MRWIVLVVGIALVAGGLMFDWLQSDDDQLIVVANEGLIRQTAFGPVMGGETRSGAWHGSVFPTRLLRRTMRAGAHRDLPSVGSAHAMAPSSARFVRNSRVLCLV